MIGPMTSIHDLLSAVADLPWYWSSKKRLRLQVAARNIAEELRALTIAHERLRHEFALLAEKAEAMRAEHKHEREKLSVHYRNLSLLELYARDVKAECSGCDIDQPPHLIMLFHHLDEMDQK